MERSHAPDRWRALLTWGSVVAALAGCKTEQAPETNEILEQALPETTVVRGAWAAAAEGGTVPDGWLKTFEDPAMEAIVGEALENNLVLRASAARVDAAAGFATKAEAALKPTVGLGVGGGAADLGTGVQGTYGTGLNVAWEADLWGRLRSRAQAAEEQFEAAAADFEFARESLAAQTAKAWYFAVETRLQLALADENVQINERLVRIVEAKREQGQVTMQDVRLARANLGTAKNNLRGAQSAFEQAVRSLEILLGRYPGADLEVGDEFVKVPPPVPAGIPSEVLERRADVVAAERRVRAAFKGVEAAKLARLPRLSLTAGGGGVSNPLLSAAGLGPGFWNAGANFFWPVYTGGALEADIVIRTAQQEAALAAYGQTALVVFGEVETTLRNDQLLGERVTLEEGVVEDITEALRLAKAQYDVGKIDLLSVLQVQARTIGARSTLLRLRDANLANRISLHLALGGSFEVAEATPEDAANSEEAAVKETSPDK